MATKSPMTRRFNFAQQPAQAQKHNFNKTPTGKVNVKPPEDAHMSAISPRFGLDNRTPTHAVGR